METASTAASAATPPPSDTHGRRIDYLRVSVTDRCNERCLYCMPEGYKGWQARSDTLTDNDIVRLVRTAAGLGFRKFRVTGGEPLVRSDITGLIGRIAEIPGVESLGLSTNGILLAPLARALKTAGLHSVNLSLDALSPASYQRITGGNLARVLDAIAACLEAGLNPLKLNCVLMKGVNESELVALAEFAGKHGLPLRFIELMPLTRTDVLTEANFLPVAEARRILGGDAELIPDDAKPGHGPARYFRWKPTGGLIGFIGALTDSCFCHGCNKMRLTSDGKLRPCLGRHGEIDLRPALAAGDDAPLRELFRRGLREKPLDHEFRDNYQPARPMTAIGG